MVRLCLAALQYRMTLKKPMIHSVNSVDKMPLNCAFGNSGYGDGNDNTDEKFEIFCKASRTLYISFDKSPLLTHWKLDR